MPRKPSTAAPRLDPVHLADLTDSAGEELDAHGSYEALRLSGVDLTGRDLSGTTFSECAFRDTRAHEVDLRGAVFETTTFDRLDAPILSAARSRFRNVVLEGSRIGSAELFDTDWNGVHVADCKLGFVNLRGAVLRDVVIGDCTVDELDLGGVRADRVSFAGTRIGTLDVTGAALANVDLRGAEVRGISGIDGLRGVTMSSDQILDLAPLFARRHGIVVED